MNILIIILICLGSLIALVFIIASFSKDDFSIEREVVINKPKSLVFNYIKYLKNTEKYSKWVMQDPNMKKDYKGEDGTEGFTYYWDSNEKNVGKGEQEIKKIREGDGVDYEIRFKKPFENTTFATIHTEAITNEQTKVIWTFSGKNKLMGKVMHLVFNLGKVLGNDMQTSLNNLKNILEK